jgi:integrase/recombinase XerD
VASERDVTALADALVDYLAVRRAVGYKLTADAKVLARFVANLDSRAIDTVTVAAAVEWATGTPRGGSGVARLTTIRGFARYLQALDAAHQVPPTRLLPRRKDRAVPHLYSDADIAALMNAARALEPSQASTFETIIGMLWVTGMRIGEVLRLNTSDLDPDTGVLTVWLSKFGKSRHVPLEASTITALTTYREGLAPTAATTAMFVSGNGQRVTYQKFYLAFVELLDTAGITTADGRRPRAHDLRHSFAVRTLLGWYRTDADVHALLPRLSTYLGHVEPSSTYWYLSAAPELMTLAAQRLDHHHSEDRR